MAQLPGLEVTYRQGNSNLRRTPRYNMDTLSLMYLVVQFFVSFTFYGGVISTSQLPAWIVFLSETRAPGMHRFPPGLQV